MLLNAQWINLITLWIIIFDKFKNYFKKKSCLIVCLHASTCQVTSHASSGACNRGNWSFFYGFRILPAFPFWWNGACNVWYDALNLATFLFLFFSFFFLLFYSKNKLPDQKIYVVLLFCLDFRFSSLAFDWMIFILIHSVNFRFIFYFCLHLNVFFPLILFLFQIWSFFLYIFCKMYDFIFNFTLKSNNAIFPLVLFLFISSSDYFILLFFFQFHPPTLCYLGIKGRGFF